MFPTVSILAVISLNTVTRGYRVNRPLQNDAAPSGRMKMRKSTRLVRAFIAASLLTGLMVAGNPLHATDSGMSSSNTFVCQFAQGVIYKVPSGAREVLKGVFEGIT